MSFPSFADFKNGNLDLQLQLLELLFERSSSLESITLKNPDFMNHIGSDYASFVEKVRTGLHSLCHRAIRGDPEAKNHLSNIIAAHPKLGQPKQKLSAHSAHEQRNLGNSDSKEILETLNVLNTRYEARYPGLRFVVFVNGRPRPEIIQVLQQRIESGNSWSEEARVACNEMCDIALDRIHKTQIPPSTHKL
ncbi:LADA_0F13454g1_1 [Lachancea dasiensis]|uniref:LADA_0F13454g1_1 n=1 Tax=Lachancea dasiensis TaxID=1072105 RepID=A0A1G4JN22_9SACH|nr:LADA_0F13454g1_1 [Lachancea dasiensis]